LLEDPILAKSHYVIFRNKKIVNRKIVRRSDFGEKSLCNCMARVKFQWKNK